MSKLVLGHNSVMYVVDTGYPADIDVGRGVFPHILSHLNSIITSYGLLL